MLELFVDIYGKRGNWDGIASWDTRSIVKFFPDMTLAVLEIYQDGESKRNAEEIKEMIQLARGDSMDVDGA